MYHISKDKRSIQSAQLIFNGLIECLKHKDFDSITITDLQKTSGVARTTFYRCFDNISDILYWKCELSFKEALMGFTEEDFMDESHLIYKYFLFWTTHSDILEILMHINRYDIIYSCHMNIANMIQEKYAGSHLLKIQHRHYFLAIRTGFTISILTAWLQNGRKESPEEIMAIVNEQFSLLPMKND